MILLSLGSAAAFAFLASAEPRRDAAGQEESEPAVLRLTERRDGTRWIHSYEVANLLPGYPDWNVADVAVTIRCRTPAVVYSPPGWTHTVERETDAVRVTWKAVQDGVPPASQLRGFRIAFTGPGAVIGGYSLIVKADSASLIPGEQGIARIAGGHGEPCQTSQRGAAPPNKQMQRTRPAQAMEPRR
jgi:hypothetical protein